MVESRLSRELAQGCVISSCSFNLEKTLKKSPVFIASPLRKSMMRSVIIMTISARLNTLFITSHRETAQKAHSNPRSRNNYRTARNAVLKQHHFPLEDRK